MPPYSPDFLDAVNNQLGSALGEDEDQEFGKPAGAGSADLSLSSQAAIARESAMNMLRQALNAQKTDISPTQGIAAALLAAIPTLGGYMLGKAVGAPKIPEGTYFKGLSPGEFNKEFAGGGSAGGLAGAQIGQDAGLGYIKQIQDFGKQQVPVLEKMAGEQSKLASELTNDAQQQRLQEDSQAFQREEIGLRESADKRLIDYRATHRETPTGFFESMTPEQKDAYIASQTGVDKAGQPIDKMSKLDPITKRTLGEIKATANEAFIIAPQIEKFKSWASLQGAYQASGLDPNANIADLRSLVDRVARTRSGAAIPPAEYAKIQSFVAGDFTLTPSQVANYLKATAARELRWGKSLLDTAQGLEDPNTRATMFEDPTEAKRRRQAELRAKAGQP